MSNQISSSYTDYKQKIKQDIQERKIEYLVHFTSIQNLSNIIQNGLLTRKELNKNNPDFYYNDNERLDGYPNSISLSISFPNFQMFSKYRIFSNPKKDMAVLLLDPKILYEKDCAFYYNNAANKAFTEIYADALQNWKSWSAMFDEEVDNRLRSELKIPNCYTTNPQAEVLSFNSIEPEYIKEIIFENKSIYLKYKDNLLKRKQLYFIDNEFFAPRKDYLFWKK